MKNIKLALAQLKSLKILFTGFCIISLISFSSTEEIKPVKLNGTVYDLNTEKELVGVSIQVSGKDMSLGTITDIKGIYNFDLPTGKYSITYSYVGYITQTKEIEVKDDSLVLDIYLEEDIAELETIVISSYCESSSIMSIKGISSRRDKKTSRSKGGDYMMPTRGPSYEVDEISYDYDDAPSGVKQEVGAGMLTAGEINDFSKWNLWQDIEKTDLKSFQNYWGFSLKERYTLQLTSNFGTPVIDCSVKLVDEKGNLVWLSKTDNTGKAEFWVNINDSIYSKRDNFTIIIDSPDGEKAIEKATQFHKGINSLKINSSCYVPNNLDAVFVVDATGSMGDEIEFLKAELNDVIQKVKEKNKDVSINLGSVFYRDEGDEYVTRESALSSDITKTVDFIKNQSANGGGDFPEAMDAALEKAINEMQWNKEARARIIFLVLDAPPHYEPNVVNRLKELTAKASALGIRIVPVTGSGIDKSTEYLMRSLALATNGTYVFLTDHSGIGNPHIEPTTDEYDVEKLNEVLIRIFDTYSSVTECGQSVIPKDETIKDTVIVNNNLKNNTDTTNSMSVDSSQIIENPDIESIDTTSTNIEIEEISWKFYPNPTRGHIWVELDGKIGELFLADVTGKILERYEVLDQDKIELDISFYPVGFYFIQYYIKDKDKWLSGKVIKVS